MALESGNHRSCGSNAGSPASLNVEAIKHKSDLVVRHVVLRARQSCTNSSTLAVPYMLSAPTRPAHAMLKPSGLQRGCDFGPLAIPVMRAVSCLARASNETINNSVSSELHEARGFLLPATTKALPSGDQSNEYKPSVSVNTSSTLPRSTSSTCNANRWPSK